MLWIKMFHLFSVIAWFAGLFYLPRLFVYHVRCGEDEPGRRRLETMERRLFWGIMVPAMTASLVFGFWLLTYGHQGGWIVAKLALALALVAYQGVCWLHMRRLRENREPRGHVYFRWFNEIPTVLLLAILWLAVLKPF